MRLTHHGTAALLALGALTAVTSTQAAPSLGKTFKNVIVMVPDGCGIAHTTIARWYKGSPLACDALHVAQVRTYGSNTLITDSAPAATAFATGYKTHDKYVGILPASYALAVPSGLAASFSMPTAWANRPVASVLEAARLKGMATGVIATSTTSHATPAGYTAHWYARSNENIIMEQQAYQGLDILFGGGRKYIESTTRTDGESIRDSLSARGYRVVTNTTELSAVPDTAARVWGQFALDAMAPDYDRTLSAYADQPSLETLTRKAITLLSGNARGQAEGFFLMVEGSQVDWASHANDPVGVMSEYIAFDKAVAAALEFAQSSNTLVLVFSDHDNGGMSLGSTRTNSNYSSLPMDSVFNANVFKRASLTGVGVAVQMGASPTSGTVTSVMNQYYGINDLTAAEIDTIIAHANPSDLQYYIGPMMSRRASIGWTTTGHTGNDLPMYYYGTNNPIGTIENTDIAALCAQAMSLNMATVNDTLFADAATLFAGATSITVDTTGVNTGRGALTVVSGARTCVFPFNKDEVIIDGTKSMLNGLTVYSYKNNKVYVPKIALDLVSGVTRAVVGGMLKTADGLATVEVYSMNGRRLRSMKVREGMVNLRQFGLADGSYVLRVNRQIVGTVSAVANSFFQIRAR